jgi:phenylacetic acid degradation protein
MEQGIDSCVSCYLTRLSKVSRFMPVYSLEGITPVVDPDAFVHETAVLIGDVQIGCGCYIGPNASLRGDFGRIIVEQGANVQDTCVMHTFPGKDCIVERNGHIGHGAVLHGCRIGVNAMVGMNAVVMDDAFIGESSIVGATAFVAADFVCPPRSLVIGVPAKIKRELTDKEIEWKSRGTVEYQQLAERCLVSLVRTEALTEAETDRLTMKMGDYDFKP